MPSMRSERNYTRFYQRRDAVVLPLTKSRESSRRFVTPNEGTADNRPFTRGVRIAMWSAVPMFKLQRVIESGIVRLIVIGRIDAAQLPDLPDLVRSESAP